MKIVAQRVASAEVAVEDKVIGSIDKGLLLLVGIAKDDTPEAAEQMALKVSKLRIFEDDKGKMNLNLLQSGGKVLSVPQFTLLADTEKGNRPGFDNALEPKRAEEIWMYFNKYLKDQGIDVREGEFGSHMHVSLVNDGPVTFIL